MPKLVVTLSQREKAALISLSHTEVRHPRDQIRIMLRRELERLGHLAATSSEIATIQNEVDCDN